ncbi:hypothetical protein M2318_004846 [Metapseudomonas resinovorans]|uniref:hypothetical protein n=1 Tax=Metapseudomonas resinovorans TaxID=53412 RepID=UPI003D23BFF0
MDELQRVLKNLEEIETILRRHDYPEPNPKALGRIQLLTAQMKGVDHYISEKVGRLANQAAVFYSARRHANPGSLHAEISSDLPSRIRAQVNHLMRLAKNQDGEV